MSKLIDITGKRYGHLTVVKRVGHHIRKSGRKDALWECLCDCGNIKNITTPNLKSGCTISCGCVQTANRYKPHRKIIISDFGEYCGVSLYNKEIALFDKSDLDKVGKCNWHMSDGYACNGKGTPMHRIILGDTGNMIVHHIDENKLNNRKSNLKLLSKQEHSRMHNIKRNATREEAERALKGEKVLCL